MGELGLVLGLTGADTGLEVRRGGPLEKKPLEGLPELKGLSTCGETSTGMSSLGHQTWALPWACHSHTCRSPQRPVTELLLHDTLPEKQLQALLQTEVPRVAWGRRLPPPQPTRRLVSTTQRPMTSAPLSGGLPGGGGGMAGRGHGLKGCILSL